MNTQTNRRLRLRALTQTAFFTRQKASEPQAGFTLMELMVVMLIIGLMSTMVITAMSGGDGTESLNSGVSKMSQMFSLAQSTAITRKTPVRVAIAYDPSDMDTFLRYVNVFFLDDTDGTWKPLTEGEYLDAGVYFSPGLSTGTEGLKRWTMDFNFDLNTFAVVSQTEALGSVTYTISAGPDPCTGSGGDQWIAYEFYANGTAVVPGARVVLVDGLVAPGELRIPNLELADGFVIFRAGRPYHFQDPEQI